MIDTIRFEKTLILCMTATPLIRASYLGRGKYATAWQDRGDVYLLVKGCHMKEALSLWASPMKHVPEVVALGEYEHGSMDVKVYRMPYYRTVEKTFHPKAWEHFKACAKALEEAWQSVRERYKVFGYDARYGQEVMNRTIDILKGRVPKSIRDALAEIADAGANYGQGVCFEFAKRNLGVDKKGNLVFRDILFDMEAIQKEQVARRRRANGF